MSKMNVLCIANMNYTKPIKPFLYSLFSHNDCDMDVYLLHKDMEDDIIREYAAFCTHWNGKTLIPIKVELEQFTDFYTTEYLPAEVYLKMVCADILPDTISKVLYLDLDMVVKKSLDRLYDTDLTGYPLAACCDIYGYIFMGKRNHERMEIGDEYTYFNAGMLLLNFDYLRAENWGEKMLDYAEKNAEKLLWLEQDVMNHFFVDKYKLLSWHEYNCAPAMYVMKVSDVESGIMRPLYQSETESMASYEGYADYTQAICDNATIIHYIGETKPWKKDRPKSHTYDIFDRYYNEYEAAAAEIEI